MTPVAVYAGNFASQPLAYAHVLDAAEAAGLPLDLDHVEMICGGDPGKRLAHVFDAGNTARIRDMRRGEDTLVLIFPEALRPGAAPFADTARLRALGTFTPCGPRLRA